MARILIVGCGCRGRALAGALQERGHVVRGTTRDARNAAALEAAGVEPVVADPLRLATLMRPIDGASAVCWLLGSARGAAEDVAALHGPRLRSLLGLLVDTHVHGFIYEAAGTIAPAVLEAGARLVLSAAETHRIAAGVVAADPSDQAAWRDEMSAAARRTLS